MAILSKTDGALIKLIRNRLENNRTDFDHMIDLLNVRIQESSNDELVRLRCKIERLKDNIDAEQKSRTE